MTLGFDLRPNPNTNPNPNLFTANGMIRVAGELDDDGSVCVGGSGCVNDHSLVDGREEDGSGGRHGLFVKQSHDGGASFLEQE